VSFSPVSPPDGGLSRGEAAPDAGPVWGLVAGGYAAGALAAGRFVPGLTAFLPVCPFRALTGLPCPTCGVTRSLLALAAGHPETALTYSPLAVATILLALAAGVWGLGRLLCPRRSLLPRTFPGRERLWARAAAVAVLLNWAYILGFSPAG
jgi:uncharacterized protein DUF2752